MDLSNVNWNTVRLIKILEELASKTEVGFKDFRKASYEDLNCYVLIDRDAEDEHGLPVVLDHRVDELHHDVISHYGDDYGEVIIRVVEDEDPYINVIALTSDDVIIIEAGRWYFP